MAYELLDDSTPSAGGGRYEVLPAEEPKKSSSLLKRAALAALPGVGPALAFMEDPEARAAGMLAGSVSAAAGIGNTLLSGIMGSRDLPSAKRGSLSSLITGQKPQTSGDRFKAENEAAASAFKAENQDRPGFTTGEVVTQIGMTAPVGGTLAAPLRAAAPLVGRAGPALDALANSIASSGMRTGLAPGLANTATRAAGGAITGGASAGLVNPDDAGMGAVIGGALPPGIQLASKGANLVAQGARAVTKPQIAQDAKTIISAGGYTPAELPAVRAGLAQQGPQIVQAPVTAPQILQNPGVSQLGRTLRNAGDTSLLNAEQLQDAARIDALNRVSPVTGTVRQAADNFGNTAQPQIVAADTAARARTSAAFDAVDPFNETRVELPIEEMQQAANRFMGRGTFGQGPGAQQALQTARTIGQETIEPVAAASAGAARQEMTLAQAVRRAGGINSATPSGQQLAGELHDLRQSPGLRGIVANGRGESVDRLAQRMHADGFIPDDDPATLLNHLRDPSLSRGYGAGADQDRIYQALREGGMGDAPGAMTVPRPVPFSEAQNLRSSIGRAYNKASKDGTTQESAALDQMRRAIDERVADVTAGNARPGEYFPADAADQWREALRLKAEQVQNFRTGPQSALFRRGADNLPSVNGGELAPKFFSPRGSQTDDINAFARVATPETRGLLKNYAIADAASQTDALGRLTNSKFNNWHKQRSGAIGGLFDSGERAQLQGVGASLGQADSATRLGMATGSNTAQNALGLGVLDSPLLNGLVSRTPVIGKFTGPMLEKLRETAKKGKVDRLGTLLADPAALERAIAAYQAASQGRPLGLGRAAPAVNLGVRAAPLLSIDQ